MNSKTQLFRFGVRRALRFARRQLTQWTFAARYWIRNRIRHQPIVDRSSDVIVSLTTYGFRLHTVYLAVESIGAGRMLPHRIILWVDRPDLEVANSLPTLSRLVERGLDIRSADGAIGSHKKYFHYVQDPLAARFSLVTADDDIFYPIDWLKTLWVEFLRTNRAQIVSSWVKRMGFDELGFSEYASWMNAADTAVDELNYFMSGSGTIYPVAFAQTLASAGKDFMKCAPKADDIWLNMQARRANLAIRQAGGTPRRIWTVPRSQRVKLSDINVTLSLNDVQLAETFSREDVARLRAISRSRPGERGVK